MIMLAVSTSSRFPSAAIMLADGSMKMKLDESGRPHSVSLGSLVDELLDECGVTLENIDLFAVDVGPGSFTGVRIGISFINALALACEKKVVPVSSLYALKVLSDDTNAKICTLLDARNGNGYAAMFEGGRCTMEPHACVLSEIEPLIDETTLVFGDCFNKHDAVNALLVLKSASEMKNALANGAQAMYLRPSQAERMKSGGA